MVDVDILKNTEYCYHNSYRMISIDLKDIKKFNDGNVYFYIYDDGSLKFSYIFDKYISAGPIDLFNNFLKDDGSKIYILKFNEKQQKEIYEVYRLYYYNLDLYIYDIPLHQIIELCFNYQIKMVPYINEKVKKIINKYVKFIIIQLTKAKMITEAYETPEKYYEWYYSYKSYLKEKLNIKDTQFKWTNELTCFMHIKKHYPDAIYQYRNKDWLSDLSIDIYVPSKKIAFEIQGIQHFTPIDFFGGEEGYKKIFENDMAKKELCILNGVRLIYINFTDDYKQIEFKIKNSMKV